MNKNQVERKKYVRPLVESVQVIQDRDLLAGSGPVTGGHHSAGDDEPLGAKGFQWFDEEDELNASPSKNIWEDRGIHSP